MGGSQAGVSRLPGPPRFPPPGGKRGDFGHWRELLVTGRDDVGLDGVIGRGGGEASGEDALEEEP